MDWEFPDSDLDWERRLDGGAGRRNGDDAAGRVGAGESGVVELYRPRLRGGAARACARRIVGAELSPDS